MYRATDTNLARQVAIKELPEAVAADAERLARFDREAKTLAALNHPNIAAIYGLEKSWGEDSVVMALINDATSLSPTDDPGEARFQSTRHCRSAKQIAGGEALEAAHEQGIIHRDLNWGTPTSARLRPPCRARPRVSGWRLRRRSGTSNNWPRRGGTWRYRAVERKPRVPAPGQSLGPDRLQ